MDEELALASSLKPAPNLGGGERKGFSPKTASLKAGLPPSIIDRARTLFRERGGKSIFCARACASAAAVAAEGARLSEGAAEEAKELRLSPSVGS